MFRLIYSLKLKLIENFQLKTNKKFEYKLQQEVQVLKSSRETVIPMMFKEGVIWSIFVSSNKVKSPHQVSSIFLFFFFSEHSH